MATTLQIAIREIYGRLKEQWDADTPAIIGGSPAAPALLLYDEAEWTGRPDADRDLAWGRAKIIHSDGEQATLAGTAGTLFRNYGVITVQCFAPMRDNTGALVARRLAEVVKTAFQGRNTTNVWFRQVRYNEVGREGTWYQMNVVANFEWDEVV